MATPAQSIQPVHTLGGEQNGRVERAGGAGGWSGRVERSRAEQSRAERSGAGGWSGAERSGAERSGAERSGSGAERSGAGAERSGAGAERHILGLCHLESAPSQPTQLL